MARMFLMILAIALVVKVQGKRGVHGKCKCDNKSAMNVYGIDGCIYANDECAKKVNFGV